MRQGVKAQEAHARNVERHLDEEGAGEEEAEVMPEGGRDRDQGIAEGVDVDDTTETEALGARGPHVVGAEVFQQAVAGKERERGEGADGHAGEGQDGVVEASAPREAVPGKALGREPTELEAEHLQQGHGEDVARDRVEDEQTLRAQRVEPAVALERLEHAERQGNPVGDGHGPEPEPEREREARLNLVPDRLVGFRGGAEVELKHARERWIVDDDADGFFGVVGKGRRLGSPARSEAAVEVADGEGMAVGRDLQLDGGARLRLIRDFQFGDALGVEARGGLEGRAGPDAQPDRVGLDERTVEAVASLEVVEFLGGGRAGGARFPAAAFLVGLLALGHGLFNRTTRHEAGEAKRDESNPDEGQREEQQPSEDVVVHVGRPVGQRLTRRGQPRKDSACPVPSGCLSVGCVCFPVSAPHARSRSISDRPLFVALPLARFPPRCLHELGVLLRADALLVFCAALLPGGGAWFGQPAGDGRRLDRLQPRRLRRCDLARGAVASADPFPFLGGVRAKSNHRQADPVDADHPRRRRQGEGGDPEVHRGAQGR